MDRIMPQNSDGKVITKWPAHASDVSVFVGGPIHVDDILAHKDEMTEEELWEALTTRVGASLRALEVENMPRHNDVEVIESATKMHQT